MRIIVFLLKFNNLLICNIFLFKTSGLYLKRYLNHLITNSMKAKFTAVVENARPVF